MGAGGRTKLAGQRKTWWTKDRVVAGLKRFYEDLQLLPTSPDRYNELKAFTGVIRNGRSSNRGWEQKYPVSAQLLYHFGGMRRAWEAVAKACPELNIQVDRGHEDWSALEDWFIVESVGIIPRVEVAELLRRSGPAIKRRLYDLNVNVYDRWGWTLNRVERILKVPRATIRKYLEHQMLPFFQGNKCIFVDPADLVSVVTEYNWSKKRHPKELEKAVRKSLAQRLCYTLMGFDWRRYRYHKIQPLRDFQSGLEQAAEMLPPVTIPRPDWLKAGVWVRVNGGRAGLSGRVGRVKSVRWTRRWGGGRRGKSTARWMATVEFRKLRRGGRPRVSLISYGFEAGALEIATRPREQGPKKPALRQGAWVRLKSTFGTTGCSAGRIGKVKKIYWTHRAVIRNGKTLSEPCWTATIECAKTKHGGNASVSRVRYSVPVSIVDQISEREARQKPPFMPGTWVRVKREYLQVGCRVGRIGKVKSVSQTYRQGPRKERRPAPVWIASVEFSKLREHTRPDVQYIQYWIAASHLEQVRKPRERSAITNARVRNGALKKAA